MSLLTLLLTENFLLVTGVQQHWFFEAVATSKFFITQINVTMTCDENKSCCLVCKCQLAGTLPSDLTSLINTLKLTLLNDEYLTSKTTFIIKNVPKQMFLHFIIKSEPLNIAMRFLFCYIFSSTESR